jgi:glycine/D-amino acid oxidase-like deaminating enzyme
MLSPGAIGRCLWTETAPPPRRPAAPVPGRVDVAVVGGGYTGLAAALALARRGAQVALLERHTLGSGASGRNGGFVLPGFRPDLAQVARRHGHDEAARLFRLSLEAVRRLHQLLADERIECDLTRCGGVTLAARPHHLAALEREARLLGRLGYETRLLTRAELVEEIGSIRYHGGILDPGACSLQPARLLQGLALAAERAGAQLLEGVEVVRVRQRAPGLELTTSRGSLRARDAVIATNGHTGAAFPWLRRRIVPVGSHLIATEPLAPEQARRLIPRSRVLSDTRRLLY